MTETKYGPWKIWNGGECPVAPETMVQVQLRGWTRPVAEAQMIDAADAYGWNWADEADDIIAYREVIGPKRETVVRYARLQPYFSNIGQTTINRYPDDNLRLHIPLVDGEIEDGAMIRVERL